MAVIVFPTVPLLKKKLSLTLESNLVNVLFLCSCSQSKVLEQSSSFPVAVCGTGPLTRGLCADWLVSVITELQGIQLVSREWENWLVWETPAHIWSQMCSKKGTQRFLSYLMKMKMGFPDNLAVALFGMCPTETRTRAEGTWTYVFTAALIITVRKRKSYLQLVGSGYRNYSLVAQWNIYMISETSSQTSFKWICRGFPGTLVHPVTRIPLSLPNAWAGN